jgi:hypothetical protein
MELSDRLKNLSPAKRALLLKVLREDAAAQPAEAETIPRRAQDGPPSLSFAQQRLWFLDQIQPGSGFLQHAGGRSTYRLAGCGPR